MQNVVKQRLLSRKSDKLAYHEVDLPPASECCAGDVLKAKEYLRCAERKCRDVEEKKAAESADGASYWMKPA